jgi:hypothetical protein
MSTPQLRKYADQLRGFNSNAGYVPGLNGEPIGRSAANVYNNLVRKNNAVSEQYEATVGSIEVPSLGRDIASQIEKRNKERYSMKGDRATFQKITRTLKDITSQDSILTLIQNLRKKIKPGYFDSRMDQLRKNIETMLGTTNDDKGLDMLAQLSDQQLNVLVDYSPFMNSLGARYEYMKGLNTDEANKPENWMSEDVYETEGGEVHKLLEWATTVNPDDTDTPRSRTGKNNISPKGPRSR